MKKWMLSSAMVVLTITAFAQDKKQEAHKLGMEAIALEDEQKFDEAIALLKKAQKLDPDDIDYPYEIAYSYIGMGEYSKATKLLEKLVKHPDSYDQVYQLLGNAYDMNGQSEKALDAYNRGLNLFPNSGKLYLESGNVFWAKKQYNEALPYYENGIKVDPSYPSNYYRASILYFNSSEEVWGMIYGEIFMNLERNTGRTGEMSKMLYDTYKSEITFTSDSSYSVSFSQNATISIDDLSNMDQFKLPFGLGLYEPLMMIAVLGEKKIDPNSLDRIRAKFLSGYSQNENSTKYPNVLFDYQQQINEAGHLEAYNHWLVMKGDEAIFETWYAENKEKFDAFAAWYNAHPLVLSKESFFHSSQY